MVALFDLCCVRAEQARCHCGPAGLYSFSIERGSPGSDETGLLPALNNTKRIVRTARHLPRRNQRPEGNDIEGPNG